MCDSTTCKQNTQTSLSFIISQSLSYDEPTEDDNDDVCVELGICQVILCDEPDTDAGYKDIVKIQHFLSWEKKKTSESMQHNIC